MFWAIIQGLLHRDALQLAQGALAEDPDGVGSQLLIEVDFMSPHGFSGLGIPLRPFLHPFIGEDFGTVFEDL